MSPVASIDDLEEVELRALLMASDEDCLRLADQIASEAIAAPLNQWSLQSLGHGYLFARQTSRRLRAALAVRIAG